MLECTEHELWASIPGWDAPDEVIEQYFDHLNACPYHTELERRTTAAVQMTFDAARSVSENGSLTFSDREEAAALDALAHLEAFRESGALVSALTLKVEGEEIGSLTFADGRGLRKKIGRRQPLQVYGRASADGPELLLSTYVPTAQDHPGSYRVRVNDRQTLLLDVKPSRGANIQFKISCLAPALAVQRRGLFTMFGGRFFNPLRAALAVFLLAIIGIGVIVYRDYARRTQVPGSQNTSTASNAEQTTAPTSTPDQTDNQVPHVEKSGAGNSATHAKTTTNESGTNRRGRRTPGRPNQSNEERAWNAAPATDFTGTPQEKAAVLASLRAGEISLAGSDFESLKRARARGSDGDDVSPIYPRNEATFETNPIFRWQGSAELEYRIIVSYLDGTEVKSSKVLSQESGRLDEELAPGTYYWRIAVRRKGGKEEIVYGFTLFKVLSRAEKQRLESATDTAGSNLVRAILYARAGFPEKAEAELNAELQKHPHSATAKKMLAQVRGWRRK
jgi:hypothetical protein